ncbi:hypothetical protein BDV96DRAFT_19418 [Lophiotrema nucula]|uniref:Uncharacterized protein n=1 Tax=Lophiotrema nucula TaxID=690887 RepID=A0A6A5ZFJ4_9PLEO|nr:hypothetical protein BDV96DRAFT_19418 [Lophiotrema nucula]
MVLIRRNLLTTGAPGVRWTSMATFFEIFQENIIPLEPLRGRISASEDLGALLYNGSSIQGEIPFWASQGMERGVTRAACALAEKGIEKVQCCQKKPQSSSTAQLHLRHLVATATCKALYQAVSRPTPRTTEARLFISIPQDRLEPESLFMLDFISHSLCALIPKPPFSLLDLRPNFSRVSRSLSPTSHLDRWAPRLPEIQAL